VSPASAGRHRRECKPSCGTQNRAKYRRACEQRARVQTRGSSAERSRRARGGSATRETTRGAWEAGGDSNNMEHTAHTFSTTGSESVWPMVMRLSKCNSAATRLPGGVEGGFCRDGIWAEREAGSDKRLGTSWLKFSRRACSRMLLLMTLNWLDWPGPKGNSEPCCGACNPARRLFSPFFVPWISFLLPVPGRWAVCVARARSKFRWWWSGVWRERASAGGACEGLVLAWQPGNLG
jgi:hypothetical protein